MDHESASTQGRLVAPLITWLHWVGASVFATSVTFLVAYLLLPAFDDPDRWAAPLFLPAFGILLALAQAVVLSKWIRNPFRWFAVSLLGWLLAYMTITALAALPRSMGFGSTGTNLVVFGASTGIAQWIALRQHFPAGALWIVASLLGWGALALVVGAAFTKPADFALVALIPAAATGVLLSWWSTQPRPAQQPWRRRTTR
jgi:hypothetical protein